jgi:hypothetical protein
MSAAQITLIQAWMDHYRTDKLSFKSTPVVDFVIPFDAKQDDISTRKMNQFTALSDAWKITASEGATGAWAALNSITRYVDNERSIKSTSGDVVEARFLSSQFGTGQLLKAKAVSLLLPRIKDKVLA